MWLTSVLIWSTHELFFPSAVPDVPLGDIFLFLALVPWSRVSAGAPKGADSASIV